MSGAPPDPIGSNDDLTPNTVRFARIVTVGASVFIPLVAYFLGRIIIDDHEQIRINTSRIDRILVVLDTHEARSIEWRDETRSRLAVLESEASKLREVDASRQNLPEQLNKIEMLLHEHDQDTQRFLQKRPQK